MNSITHKVLLIVLKTSEPGQNIQLLCRGLLFAFKGVIPKIADCFIRVCIIIYYYIVQTSKKSVQCTEQPKLQLNKTYINHTKQSLDQLGCA